MMKQKIYESERSVEYSLCDSMARLSLKSYLELNESAASFVFDLVGCNNHKLKDDFNAMWVFVKNDLHILKPVFWGSKFHIRAFITYFSKLKAIVETQFISEDNELFAYSILECCVLDKTSHRLRLLSSVNFPSDLEVIEGHEFISTPHNEDFIKISDFIVESTDIDFSHHMNNVAYIRHILNTYTLDELDNMSASKLEAYFLKETMVNQKLSIYKTSENNIDTFLIKREDEDVFKMVLVK